MNKGDKVKFKSKNASKDYRTLQRGQKWSTCAAAEFCQQLKKNPFQQMEIIEITQGHDMVKGTDYEVALLTYTKIPVPCSLLVPA